MAPLLNPCCEGDRSTSRILLVAFRFLLLTSCEPHTKAIHMSKKPTKKTKDEPKVYGLLLRPSERARYQQAANKAKRPLASWIRVTLDQAIGGGCDRVHAPPQCGLADCWLD